LHFYNIAMRLTRSELAN